MKREELAFRPKKSRILCRPGSSSVGLEMNASPPESRGVAKLCSGQVVPGAAKVHLLFCYFFAAGMSGRSSCTGTVRAICHRDNISARMEVMVSMRKFGTAKTYCQGWK